MYTLNDGDKKGTCVRPILQYGGLMVEILTIFRRKFHVVEIAASWHDNICRRERIHSVATSSSREVPNELSSVLFCSDP